MVNRLKKIKTEKNHLTAIFIIILFSIFSGVFIRYLSKEIKLGVLVSLLVLLESFITIFLCNQLYKNVYKKIVKKSRKCIGEFQVKDNDKKVFAVIEEITK